METDEMRKLRKQEERRKRKEEKQRQKQEELNKSIAEREKIENEDYEPSIMKQKGYELVDNIIGKGKFEVYKIKKGSADIAMKLINLETLDREYKEKFLQREINILENINGRHKNIVPIFDIFKTKKRMFIMMEYMINGDLQDYIDKNNIDETQAKKWLVQLCKAINYLHTNDITHRNLRTENCLLDNNLNLKITGFSYARLTIDPYTSKTVFSATRIGVEPYFAPEIVRGEHYDPKASDVWSIGVVMFIILNKKYPFDFGDFSVLITQQQKQTWKERCTLDINEKIKELLASMLEYNFRNRIKVKQILEHSSLQGIEGNAVTDRDEKADIRDNLKRAFVTEGIEKPNMP